MTSDARTTADTLHSVVREIRIAASPEIVWSFLVEEDKVVKWEAGAAAFDLRPGGAMRLDIHPGQNIALGEFRVVQPFERLAFTWGWQDDDGLPPGSTLVDITLTPDGDETVVRLEHTELPTEEAAQQHGEGWEYYLGRLGIAAPGGDPGPDQWADAPPQE
jgi:uncharacterized protein YndB with AHSA1/START domain